MVIAKYSQYLQVLQLIADLHGVSGPVVVAPDGSGLLRPPNMPPVPGAQKG